MIWCAKHTKHIANYLLCVAYQLAFVCATNLVWYTHILLFSEYIENVINNSRIAALGVPIERGNTFVHHTRMHDIFIYHYFSCMPYTGYYINVASSLPNQLQISACCLLVKAFIEQMSGKGVSVFI